MSSTISDPSLDLSPGEIPLIVAPIASSSSHSEEPQRYILFIYTEKLRNPDDTQGTPYLIEKPLNHLPKSLSPYLTPYPIYLAPSLANNKNDTQTFTTNPDVSRQQSTSFPKHLKYMTIINSKTSGKKRSSDIYFNIITPLLQKFGMSHVYVATSSAQSIPNHAKSFTDSSTVVFLAGDTSVSEFVNCLEPHENQFLNLIIIPTGTGNALANSCGLTSIPKAISRMFLGSPQPLANFRVEFPHGTTIVETAQDEQQSGSIYASSNIGGNSINNSSDNSTSKSTSDKNFSSQTATPDQPNLLQLYNKGYFSSMIFHSIAVVSWAIHASLVADSDSPELRHLGEARFKKAAEDNMARPQQYHGKIVLGDCSINENKSTEPTNAENINSKNYDIHNSATKLSTSMAANNLQARYTQETDARPDLENYDTAKKTEQQYNTDTNQSSKITTAGPTKSLLSIKYLNSPITIHSATTPTNSNNNNSHQETKENSLNKEDKEHGFQSKQLEFPYQLPTLDHAYVLFTLVSEIEKGYLISPNSKSPSDLNLRLIHTDYTNNQDLMTMMMAPYKQGSHVTIGPNVQYYELGYSDSLISPLSDSLTKNHNINSSNDDNNSSLLKLSSSSCCCSSSSSPKTQNITGNQVLAAEIYPQQEDPNYERWCIDGLILKVPANTGPVKIYLPTYKIRGWSLNLVV